MKKLQWYFTGLAVLCLLVFSVFMWPAYFFSPSERQGTAVVRQAIRKEANGRIRLESFKKLGGEFLDVVEGRGYRMNYEFAISFTENCQWGRFSSITNGQDLWWHDFYTYVEGGTEELSLTHDDTSLREGRTNTLTTIRGTIVFQSHKGQWRGEFSSMGTIQTTP